jgi:hypothetical protein
MTFGEIQAEVIRTRFKEGQRESVKLWINTRYQGIWGFADWPWKRQGPVDIAVTTGSANPTLPTGFLRPVMVFDDIGNELEWMEPDEFDREHRYLQLNDVTARSGSFKWVDDVITLGPTPNADATYSLVYDRKLTYLSGGSTPMTGFMVNANDVPIFDAAYHYALVVGALATGLRVENDPTYPQMEDEYSGLLSSMRDHYLPTASPGNHLQYGRGWDSY